MIVIPTQCFPPAPGGIETLMHSLAAALTARDRKVVVFADRYGTADTAFDRDQPFPVHRHGGWKPWRRWRKARDVSGFAATLADKPALVTDSWKSLELVDTRSFAKTICLCHGTEIPTSASASKTDRIRRALAKAGHVVANSEYTAGRVRTYLDDPRKLRVILPGVSAPVVDEQIEQRIRERISGRDPVLITLARLEPRKGHLAVIRMLPKLIAEFPTLQYVIAGNGGERKTLEQAIAAAGLESHVLFTGSVRDPEKAAWLKHSTLFVMPGKAVGTDIEGFGLAYIEAALHGIPSIACKTGGAPEAALHRQTGIVCPPEDEEKLAQVTLDLLRNRPYIRQLGMNARARAGAFLWERKIDEYLALL